MTKRDLVIRISNETGLVQQTVLDIVQKTLDYIAEAVAQGKKVELRNFGVFEVKNRPPRPVQKRNSLAPNPSSTSPPTAKTKSAAPTANTHTGSTGRTVPSSA